VPPGPPEKLKVNKIGPDYVTLEWQPPTKDGGSKVTGYRVEKCEETSDDWVKVEDLKAFDLTLKVTGLKDTVGYFFAVSAQNSAGLSEPCETDKAVKPKKPEGPPGPPTGPLRTVDVDKTSVTLSWKPPKDDGGSPLTEYVFECRESTRTTWTKVASVPPDDTEYQAKDLDTTIDYLFRVCAKNKHGVSSGLETESTVRPKSKFGKSQALL
jgi:titin